MTMKKKKQAPLTHANSDENCLKDNANFIERLLYRFSLHNGAYGLNAYEIACLYSVYCFSAILVSMHLYAFAKGFWTGVMAAREAALEGVSTTEVCPQTL
jgi:hypothetical protein